MLLIIFRLIIGRVVKLRFIIERRAVTVIRRVIRDDFARNYVEIIHTDSAHANRRVSLGYNVRIVGRIYALGKLARNKPFAHAVKLYFKIEKVGVDIVNQKLRAEFRIDEKPRFQIQSAVKRGCRNLVHRVVSVTEIDKSAKLDVRSETEGDVNRRNAVQFENGKGKLCFKPHSETDLPL